MHHMQLEWIAAKDLRVDHAYQRPEKKAWIKWLVNNWDIEKCDALFGARRNDGLVWLTEGQQRRAAAMQIDPEMLLPVCVRQSKGIANESGLYLSSNHKLRQSPREIWDAKIVEDVDPIYLGAQAMLEKNGLHIADHGSKTTVSAIASVISITKGFGVEVLDAALYLCGIALQDEEDPYQGVMVKGVATFLHRNRKRQIDHDRLVRAIQKQSVTVWKNKARDLDASAGGTSHMGSLLATLFADAYNAGLRNEDKMMIPLPRKKADMEEAA